jgi:hypothetical protein
VFLLVGSRFLKNVLDLYIAVFFRLGRIVSVL